MQSVSKVPQLGGKIPCKNRKVSQERDENLVSGNTGTPPNAGFTLATSSLQMEAGNQRIK